MPSQLSSIEYICPSCGYPNIWTREEILRRGRKEIFKDIVVKEDRYSLPCKNPTTPQCLERYVVAVEKSEE